MTTDELLRKARKQIEEWPLARRNYAALENMKRRDLRVVGFDCSVLYNPARIVSTGAKVENGNAGDRPCFLCAGNRPSEQVVLERRGGFEVLVNPYPILNPHFTIVSERHEPQSAVPDEMIRFAKDYPGLTAFFNGAKAGASAPDHLHFQAVATDELPLMRIAEEYAPRDGKMALSVDTECGKDVVFIFAMLRGEDPEQMDQIKRISGFDPQTKKWDPDRKNVYAFMGKENELITVVVIRHLHRPTHYYEEGDKQLLISPGAIDMAGLIVTPRIEDFERLTNDQMFYIYRQTGIAHDAELGLLGVNLTEFFEWCIARRERIERVETRREKKNQRSVADREDDDKR